MQLIYKSWQKNRKKLIELSGDSDHSVHVAEMSLYATDAMYWTTPNIKHNKCVNLLLSLELEHNHVFL